MPTRASSGLQQNQGGGPRSSLDVCGSASTLLLTTLSDALGSREGFRTLDCSPASGLPATSASAHQHLVASRCRGALPGPYPRTSRRGSVRLHPGAGPGHPDGSRGSGSGGSLRPPALAGTGAPSRRDTAAAGQELSPGGRRGS